MNSYSVAQHSTKQYTRTCSGFVLALTTDERSVVGFVTSKDYVLAKGTRDAERSN